MIKPGSQLFMKQKLSHQGFCRCEPIRLLFTSTLWSSSRLHQNNKQWNPCSIVLQIGIGPTDTEMSKSAGITSKIEDSLTRHGISEILSFPGSEPSLTDSSISKTTKCTWKCQGTTFGDSDHFEERFEVSECPGVRLWDKFTQKGKL